MRSAPVTNLRLYPWYAILYETFFWVPVFFLFFNEHLGLEQVLLLESIYFISVVALEIPSGYFSDTLGRRVTMILASTALVASYFLFFIAETFPIFVAAQVLLALGVAFNSGTTSSFLYDTLVDLDRSQEYGPMEASIGHRAFLAGAAGALLGGAVGMADERYAYGLSLLASIPMLLIAISLTEPASTKRRRPGSRDIMRQLRQCRQLLRQPVLRWLMVYAIIMVMLNHVPWEFFQPYLKALGGTLGLPSDTTPLATGIYTAITMLIAAWCAKRSIRIRDRIGLAGTLFLALLIQVVLIGLMSAVLSTIVAVAVLARSAPRALMTAPMNAAMAPRVPTEIRASWFSLMSLGGRLAFAGWLVVLASVATEHGEASWADIQVMLQWSLLAAAIGAGVLVVFLPKEVLEVGESSGPNEP